MKISVIGAGAFGTAISCQLVRAGNEVLIWAYEEEVSKEINKLHQNFTYLPDIILEQSLRATSSLDEALEFSKINYLVTPIFVLPSVLPKRGEGRIFICASKGITKGTFLVGHEVAKGVVAGDYKWAVISGPSFAKEVAEGKNTKVVLACEDLQVAAKVRKTIETLNFKVDICRDVVGVELCGALKNVLAVLAGMIVGAGMGRDFAAICFTEGLCEMIRIGEAMGAVPQTFYMVCGVGDLFLTSTSDQSRNFSYGFVLGSGDALNKSNAKNVVEGVETSEAVYNLSKKFKLKTPLFDNVYEVLFNGKSSKKALADIWRAI